MEKAEAKEKEKMKEENKKLRKIENELRYLWQDIFHLISGKGGSLI